MLGEFTEGTHTLDIVQLRGNAARVNVQPQQRRYPIRHAVDNALREGAKPARRCTAAQLS